MTKTFLAEVKNVTAVKTISNDMEAQIKFITSDKSILDLGKLPSDTIFEVTVKVAPKKEAAPSWGFNDPFSDNDGLGDITSEK